jgi:hypothetical protein
MFKNWADIWGDIWGNIWETDGSPSVLPPGPVTVRFPDAVSAAVAFPAAITPTVRFPL